MKRIIFGKSIIKYKGYSVLFLCLFIWQLEATHWEMTFANLSIYPIAASPAGHLLCRTFASRNCSGGVGFFDTRTYGWLILSPGGAWQEIPYREFTDEEFRAQGIKTFDVLMQFTAEWENRFTDVWAHPELSGLLEVYNKKYDFSIRDMSAYHKPQQYKVRYPEGKEEVYIKTIEGRKARLEDGMEFSSFFQFGEFILLSGGPFFPGNTLCGDEDGFSNLREKSIIAVLSGKDREVLIVPNYIKWEPILKNAQIVSSKQPEVAFSPFKSFIPTRRWIYLLGWSPEGRLAYLTGSERKDPVQLVIQNMVTDKSEYTREIPYEDCLTGVDKLPDREIRKAVFSCCNVLKDYDIRYNQEPGVFPLVKGSLPSRDLRFEFRFVYPDSKPNSLLFEYYDLWAIKEGAGRKRISKWENGKNRDKGVMFESIDVRYLIESPLENRVAVVIQRIREQPASAELILIGCHLDVGFEKQPGNVVGQTYIIPAGK